MGIRLRRAPPAAGPPSTKDILWYTKHPIGFTFHLDATDRIHYMGPGLVGAEKAARGKTPPMSGGTPSSPPPARKRPATRRRSPSASLQRIVRVHSNPGDIVLDFFAGSGTTSEAAAKNGRSFLLIDENPEAVAVMRRRLAAYLPV